ncbi:MAG: HAD family hydrolase [Elusimicrobia bacterium]|nr:HAD family hydrolase [Elusimicrobiota bacterium]MDE2426512.1 HAD family hydrolase [Elusimicrobiota bacterium]
MKVLLFDVDGTLIRAGGAGRGALDAACRRLYGKRNACSQVSLAGRTDLWNFRQAFLRSVGRKPTAAELERLHRAYLESLPRHIKKALRDNAYVLPKGVRGLLKRLSREKDVLLGLGTGNMERGARLKLEPSGLNAYFLFGGYGSDAFHRPTLLKRAVRRARALASCPIRDEDVFVIGDTPLDVAAGKKAGYKTIGVGTGFSRWEDLVASRPDHLARDFRRIDRWLSWIGIR